MPDAARMVVEKGVHHRYCALETFTGATECTCCMRHMKVLLAENERLEAMDTLLRKTLETQGGHFGNALYEAMKLEADRKALVAYVRIKRQYDEQQLRGRFKHITQTDVDEAWQALSQELQDLIDE